MNEPPAPQTPPKPGLPLIVTSMLVIGGCLLAMAWLVMAFMETLPSFLSLIFMLLEFVLGSLIWRQHRGVFRGDAYGLKQANIILIYICAVAAVLGIGLTVLAVFDRILYSKATESVSDFLRLGLVFLAVGFVLGAGRWLNYRHARAIQHSGFTFRPQQITILDLMFITVAIAIIASLMAARDRTGMWFGIGDLNYAEHVTAAEAPFDLPAGATDVNYCLDDYGSIVIEFGTDEATFLAWAKGEVGISLEPIVQPEPLSTYRQVIPGYPGPNQQFVRRGLKSERSLDNVVFVLFDSESQRAYYSGVVRPPRGE